MSEKKTTTECELDAICPGLAGAVQDGIADALLATISDAAPATVLASAAEAVATLLVPLVRDLVADVADGPVPAAAAPAVLAAVRKSIFDAIFQAVGGNDTSGCRAATRDAVGAMAYASHDAGFNSYVDYMRRVLKLRSETEKYRGLLLLGRLVGWWAPYKEIAILQERHVELHMDATGRLHNESGMAVRYPDGWGVWVIGGVQVTEQIVMRPETLTVADIEGQSNEEVRRICIDRLGWGRYLHMAGAKVVDRRVHPRDHQPETLYELPNGAKRLAVFDPSTGREYFLGVARECTTVEAAQSWMSQGLDRFAMHRS